MSELNVLPVAPVLDAADVGCGDAVSLSDACLVTGCGSDLAYLLGGELRFQAPLAINRGCDEFEMGHVDAAPIPTQMVDLKFGGDCPVCLLPGEAVSQAISEDPITRWIAMSRPDMTTRPRLNSPEFVVTQPLQPRIMAMNEADGMATEVAKFAATDLGKRRFVSTSAFTESRRVRRRDVRDSAKVVPSPKSDGFSLNVAIGAIGMRREGRLFAAAALAKAVGDSIVRHAASLLEVVCRGCRDPFSAPPYSTVGGVA